MFSQQFSIHPSYVLCKIGVVVSLYRSFLWDNSIADVINGNYINLDKFLCSYEATNDKELKTSLNSSL